MAPKKKEIRPEWLREGWYMDPAEWQAQQEARDDSLRETAVAWPEGGAAPLETGRESNANAGHRGRLRERFRENQGFGDFQDHEILELILTYGSPRRDTKQLAKNLLDTYGNLKCVFEARPESLMKIEGVGEVQATLISMIMPLTRV